MEAQAHEHSDDGHDTDCEEESQEDEVGVGLIGELIVVPREDKRLA